MTAEKQTDQLDALNSAADASDDFSAASDRTEAASPASFAGTAQNAVPDAMGPRFDTTPLNALKADIKATPDSLDGISLAGAKREAAFKLDAAINALMVLRKLAA